VDLGKKKEGEEEQAVKQSRSVLKKIETRSAAQQVEESIEDQFKSGRLFAVLASRPGQSGRADGYILEGDELEFYKKKMERKKAK
jgi:small subunit ribosomal protein S8e